MVYDLDSGEVLMPDTLVGNNKFALSTASHGSG